MTVADIKEYIDNAIDTAFAQSIVIDTAEILKKALIDTKGFLDELEPNTISQAIKVIENEEEKLKFDVDKHQIDSCLFEIRNILRIGTKENEQ